VRRQHRHRLAQPRHRYCLRAYRIGSGNHAVFDHAIEHAVTCGSCGIWITVEPSVFRRLRQRHQQCRFRKRQAFRLLAEIGDRGGANAFEITAERRHRQIQIENLALGHLPLDLDGTSDLPEFGGDGTLPPRLHQAGQLHGDGRTAGHDMAARDQLKSCAAKRERIDTGVGMKAAVLVGEQQLEIGRIDIAGGIDRQPPAPIRHGVSTQQLAVAVDDARRNFSRLLKRQRSERSHPSRNHHRKRQADCSQRHQPRPPDANGPDHVSLAYLCAHLAERTSTEPVLVRP
jgi:hypothetical protein